MKIAIIGHGTMGRLVSRLAIESGHDVSVVPSLRDDLRNVETLASHLAGHDVAIDFSVANTVVTNVTACAIAGVPLVEGTTGWKLQEDRVREIATTRESSIVFGANFSIGMNLFYRIAKFAGSVFGAAGEYDVFIEEAHHKRKIDAPSGTALVLQNLISVDFEGEISMSSTRAGYIPGTHRVGFDGHADQIMLVHTARSREGFASGAIFAANWIVKHRGFFEFSEVIDDLLKRKVD